jgi:hypothetical protein
LRSPAAFSQFALQKQGNIIPFLLLNPYITWNNPSHEEELSNSGYCETMTDILMPGRFYSILGQGTEDKQDYPFAMYVRDDGYLGEACHSFAGHSKRGNLMLLGVRQGRFKVEEGTIVCLDDLLSRAIEKPRHQRPAEVQDFLQDAHRMIGNDLHGDKYLLAGMKPGYQEAHLRVLIDAYIRNVWG